MTILIERQIDIDEQLPLISLTDLRQGDSAQVKKVADALGKAAREIGFFRVCDHGIDPSLIKPTYEASRQFFLLPDAVKQRYYIGKSTNHRGYVPFTEKGDYSDEINRSYESFDLGFDLPEDDIDYRAGNRLLGPNVWPTLTGFQRTVAAYYDKISKLGALICSAFEMHLGLPIDLMTGQMSKPISQLRLLHYVRKSGIMDHASVNMGAHTDYECLTLLHTRNKGLQIMTQEDQWIDVPVDPAVFIVNIGDMLEASSNGLFRSTPHRVLNLSPERYSLPYFVATNYDTVIKPFPQLVAPAVGTCYEPFTAGAHLERMLCRDFPYLKRTTESDLSSNLTGASTSIENPFERRLNGVAT